MERTIILRVRGLSQLERRRCRIAADHSGGLIQTFIPLPASGVASSLQECRSPPRCQPCLLTALVCGPRPPCWQAVAYLQPGGGMLLMPVFKRWRGLALFCWDPGFGYLAGFVSSGLA